MKTIYLVLVAMSIIGIMSCQTESDLFDEISLEDEIAIEGMEEAFLTSSIYNDSLIWCSDVNNSCDKASIDGYDMLFHEHDDLYKVHHNNYSHNNIEDDHHHDMMSQHHHGNIEHEEGGHHGHSIESYQEMNALRENHNLYHPN